MNLNSSRLLEWGGVITAILYSFFVAFNIGYEFLAFSLLLISAITLAIWSKFKSHNGILTLQLFYAVAAIVGMFRWFA